MVKPITITLEQSQWVMVRNALEQQQAIWLALSDLPSVFQENHRAIVQGYQKILDEIESQWPLNDERPHPLPTGTEPGVEPCRESSPEGP